MCGIVGLIGNLILEDKKIFRNLLFIDTLRGRDSTGVLMAKHDDWSWIKRAEEADTFLARKEVDDLIDTLGVKVLLGHNRAATAGSVVAKNAHPFTFNNLTGVHNGTLTDMTQLDYHSTPVDSERLYYHLERNGVQDTINKAQGAYALVWLDADKGTLNFLRNKDRPFHYIVSKDGKKCMFASERGQLLHMLDKHKLANFNGELTQKPFDFNDIVELEPYVHVTIAIPNDWSALKIGTREMEEPDFPKGYGARPHGYYDDWDSFAPTVPATVSKKKSNNIIALPKKEDKNGELAAYSLHETIYFTMDEVKTNRYNQEYSTGVTLNGEEVEVRVYLQQRMGLKEEVGKDKIFTGQINKYPHGDCLFVSAHTVIVEDSVPDEPEKEEIYLGFQKQELTRAQMFTLLQRGCSWCGDCVPIDDHVGNISWSDKDTYVCNDCISSPHYQHEMGYH